MILDCPIMPEQDSEDINPYVLLGLKTEATERDIKSAYRKLSLSVHPDRVRLPLAFLPI